MSLQGGQLLGENEPLALVSQGCDKLGEVAEPPKPRVGSRVTLEASEVLAGGAGSPALQDVGCGRQAQAGTEDLLSTRRETPRP